MKLPAVKQQLLDDIVNDLKNAPNVTAVVLGGSYAAGMAIATSDLDIGIYYRSDAPFDIEAIRAIAVKYAGGNPPTVTGFYEWGPWVNGGAWISTPHGEVDFLYKNIEQISSTIAKARAGEWENDFEQQPPYGFSSIIYLAETQACIPLYDPEGIIKTLKAEVAEYPAALKQNVIQRCLWAAEFSLWQAESFAAKQDVYATTGCLTRAVKNLITTLFSLNERYFMGDKRALEILESCSIKPADLTAKTENVLCVRKDTLEQNTALLKTLFNETAALTNGLYKPFYQL